MKRTIIGTIALVGVLAVAAVRLPRAQVQPVSGSLGGHALGGEGYPLVFSQDAEAVAPLVITKGRPSLPPIEGAGGSWIEPVESNHGSLQRDLGSRGDPAQRIDLLKSATAAVESRGIGDASDPGAPNLGEGGPQTGGDSQTENYPQDIARPNIPQERTDVGALSQAVTGEGPGRHAFGPPEPGGEPERRMGFVSLDAAMKRHPRWGELAQTEGEMEALRSAWQRYVDASEVTGADIARCCETAQEALGRATGAEGEAVSLGIWPYADALESRLGEMEGQFTEEAAGRVEAKTRQIRAKLEDDLYAERGRLNQEFDVFKERTIKEHYLSLINIQLKLKLLKLSDAERSSLEESLENLTRQMQQKLDSKQKELDDAFAAYSEKMSAEAQAELEAFQAEQERWVSSRLQEERALLEGDLARCLGELEKSFRKDSERCGEDVSRQTLVELSARREQLARDFARKEAEFTAKWEGLKAKRDAIRNYIREDVVRASQELGRAMGIEVKVLVSGVPELENRGRDLTEDLLRSLRDM